MEGGQRVQLKAPLVVHHDLLHALHRFYDYILDLVERFADALLPVLGNQVELQSLKEPLASYLFVVALNVLLNRIVGQMLL